MIYGSVLVCVLCASLNDFCVCVCVCVPAGEEAAKETVLFSALVGKINRKDKEQQRVLMITDRALYNLMPSSYGESLLLVVLLVVSPLCLTARPSLARCRQVQAPH